MSSSRVEYHEVFDGKGNLVERVERVVPAEQVHRDEAPRRAKEAYVLLREWAQDAKVAGEREGRVSDSDLQTLVQRFGAVCDTVADLLMVQHLDT